MFNFKSIISACVALAILSTSTATLAEDSSAATNKPAAKKSAKKRSSAPETAPATAPVAPVPEITLTPEDIKLRSGSGDPVAGAEKSALCMGCHGEEGNSIDPLIPKLAGQFGQYIAKQVRNYQDGIRTHQIMGAVAAAVTDEDLADMGAYFASRPMMKGDAPSNNQLGRDLFEKGDLSRMLIPCGNCHGVTGKGQNSRNPMFPVIGGQHKDYLLGQLMNFKKGDRANSPGGIMNITVQRLTDAELEALAEYVAGL